jgi:hypothetical protein
MRDIIERIEVKVDKIDEKLDKFTERLVKTEEMADNNKALIRIALASILGIAGTVIGFAIKFIMGNP